MSSSRTASGFAATGAWRRAALALAWVVGIALQARQADLWPAAACPSLLAGGGLGLVLATALRRRHARLAIALAVAAALASGFGWAGWRAQLRLADALAPAWEGRDIELVGTVDEMPQVSEEGDHFAFAVQSARALPVPAPQARRLAGFAAGDAIGAAGEATGASADVDLAASAAPPTGPPIVPSRVWLTWPRELRDDRAVAATPAPLRAGQRWRLPVRLREPHGALNPDGFDAELWLFEQGLRATGSVRPGGALLDEGWAPIERARQWVRDRLLLRGTPDELGPQAAGALAALAVGDQAAIGGAGWEVFRATGVSHLMSISGMHITMLGWLGGLAVSAAWRRAGSLPVRVPAPVAGRWGAVLVAWLYALVAGWGVPARRTVVMLASGALLRSQGLDWPPPLVALAATLPVTLMDPWALLQPGFWLSFAAVGLLMLSEPARAGPAGLDEARLVPKGLREGTGDGAAPGDPSAADATRPGRVLAAARAARALARRGAAALGRTLAGGARTQLVATVGLAPLTLLAFQQISLVGLLANLVAEPWITLVVTPLALLGALAPPLWTLAALALAPLLSLLAWLARWPLASLHVATSDAWGVAGGLAGGVLLVLPLPWRVRLCGVALLPPLVAPFVARPPPGRFELVAADVGQGSAILVRTHAHLLLFDTGPRFGPDSDAGRRLLLPLLQARGEPRIDMLVLSHADADHVGGAQSLLDGLPVRALRTSLPPGHPLRAGPVPHVPCAAGQAWSWDGVALRMLHPAAAGPRSAKTNATSCVLRVADAAGRSALLTGDVEAPQEAALVARDAGALASDVLLVPHHGSRTSSTAAFLDAVRPAVAVIQVGYRSRYGHPAPEVLARYAARGIAVVRTDTCGAWSWQGGAGVCTRAVRRRYWHWKARVQTPNPGPPPGPAAGGAPGSVVAIDSRGSPRGAAHTHAGGSAGSP